MTDRERRLSKLSPEMQFAGSMFEDAVEQVEAQRKKTSVWRRIGKIALWWCAIMGALNMIGMAFLLLDKMMR